MKGNTVCVVIRKSSLLNVIKNNGQEEARHMEIVTCPPVAGLKLILQLKRKGREL